MTERWQFDLGRGFTVADLLFIEEVAEGTSQPGQFRRLVELVARFLVAADGRKLEADEAQGYIRGLTADEFWQLVQAFGEAVRQRGNPPSGT